MMKPGGTGSKTNCAQGTVEAGKRQKQPLE